MAKNFFFKKKEWKEKFYFLLKKTSLFLLNKIPTSLNNLGSLVLTKIGDECPKFLAYHSLLQDS